MGMDFVALLRYRRTREVVRAINGLENQRRPLSAEVQALWGDSGFFRFDWDRASWVSRDDGRQVKRPAPTCGWRCGRWTASGGGSAARTTCCGGGCS